MRETLAKPSSPLGLPPGSIRGLLAIQITAIFLLLLVVPAEKMIPMPLNVYFLLSLVMVFFVAHGSTIHERSNPSPSPLYLPGGSLRFLIIAAVGGSIVYLGMNHAERFDTLQPSQADMAHWKYYLGSLAGGFFLGHFLKIIPIRHGWVFQSFQAWIALLTMLSLLLETILQVFVKPTLSEMVNFLVWQCAVIAISAFYYGVRS